jgi:16S rRNA (cytosine967-C5)-methyltransferase
MKYLKPNGKILYSTCSILSDENEKQIEHFVKDHKLKLWQNKYFQSLPVTGGQDGFFSALLTR